MPRALLLLLTIIWCTVGRAVSIEGAPLAVPVDGEPFSATLAALNETDAIFAASGKNRTLPLADLVIWGAFVEPSQGLHVLLVDGGLIVSETARLDGENLTGESVTFGMWQMPIDRVAGIILQSPFDHAAADRLVARIRSATGRDDRLLLDNGDQVTGTLTALDATKAVLRGDDGPLEIKIGSLAAIVFDPSLASQRIEDEPRTIVGFQDGSRVIAKKLSTDGTNVQLTLAGNTTLTSAASWIVALQPLGGRVQYLSDLEPASYRHIPYLELTWPYHNDHSVSGSQLRAKGRLYLKGLGMHSPARITYNLDGVYRRFDSEVAIDDEAKGRGSVQFRLFIDDGSGAWQQLASSEIIRGGQLPQRFSADLTGAKRISLLVDFADRGDELDHADWLSARLIR